MNLKTIKCPHCKDVQIRKNGHNNGRQRYQCLNPNCGKTFNENSIKPEIAFNRQSALHLLILGYEENEIADVIGLDVKDIIDWRHKFLPTLELPNPDKALKIKICYEYIKRLQRGNRPRRFKHPYNYNNGTLKAIKHAPKPAPPKGTKKK